MNISSIPFVRWCLGKSPLVIALLSACLSWGISAQAQTGPTITLNPVSQTVFLGATVTFTATVTGDPVLTYRWQKNGNNVAGGTGTTLTIPSVTANDAGNYTLYVYNATNSATSKAALLTVVTSPNSAIVSFLIGDTSNLGYTPVPVDEGTASLFLIKASFGPTAAAITDLLATGYSGWIDEQLTIPPTYHLPYVRERANEFLIRSPGNNGYLTPRQEAWWQYAVTAPDQLRQRMAFALSQILVISQDSSLSDDNDGVAAFYDILVNDAFGNYRQLLDDVTLSPMMGTYLSMIRNQKANAATGQQPDENYAREVMQLFTIGLSQLNLDGSLQLDVNGQPIPTYTQNDIVGLANVFTGWGPHYDPANPPKQDNGTNYSAKNWFLYGWDPIQPMSFNTTYGDLQTRTIVGGVTVAGTPTLTGPQRLKLALDTLFNHPNVGPFLARQLIQRFVTSNPTPAYISRVASVFNNNGSGVRGDLAATLRAILLDLEAHRADPLADGQFGKLTEPLLRMTRIFRAFQPTPKIYGASGDNRLFLDLLESYPYYMDEEAPLYAPTVFNFFKPGFAQPGAITAAGLVSPEFQIFDSVTAMQEANRNYSLIYSNISVTEPVPTGMNIKLDLSEPLAILTSPTYTTHPAAQAALVDYFNRRLLGGLMSPFLRQEILNAYTAAAAASSSFNYTAANELKRVQLGLDLVMFSPEFNVQH